MAMHLLSPVDLSQFFTVESDTGCYQEELSLAVNSGAVFFLCLLVSMIICLSLVVTYGVSALFLSTFVAISNSLCKEYHTPCLGIFKFLTIYH